LKKIKEFLELMNFLINDQLEKVCYNDESNTAKKISIMNTYSIYYLNLAVNENDLKQKREYFANARMTFYKSDKIKADESSALTLKGYFINF